MGIGKVLGKVFNPEKLGDSIISGVDKAILTKEERMDYAEKFLVLYEPYKLAQRIIAILFISVYLLVHIITAVAHIIYVLSEKPAKAIIELYKYNNDNLGYPVLTIVGFYFAGGLLEGVATKVKAKKDKKQIRES